MTTNPEKLWAYVYDWARHPGARIGIRASASKEDAKKALAVTRGDDMCVASEPQAYVREDVAAAREAAAEAKYKNRDVEVMRVALADLRRIRGCLATRANTLRTIGEEDRAKGLEDAIKQLDEEVFT